MIIVMPILRPIRIQNGAGQRPSAATIVSIFLDPDDLIAPPSELEYLSNKNSTEIDFLNKMWARAALWPIDAMTIFVSGFEGGPMTNCQQSHGMVFSGSSESLGFLCAESYVDVESEMVFRMSGWIAASIYEEETVMVLCVIRYRRFYI